MTDRPATHADKADIPRYREALVDASGRVPDETVDWEAFHVRLAARADLSLARLRHPHVAGEPQKHQAGRRIPFPGTQWWEYAARWSRLTISASIAAGIALVAVIRLSPKGTTELGASAMVATNSDPADGTRAAFESAVVGRSSTWTIDSALMPSVTDLLIPLGTDGASR
jgi:hypothetical protein